MTPPGDNPRRRPKRRWSREHDELLAFYWGHMPPEEIGRKLGRTAFAIRNRGVRLRLPPPRTFVRTLNQAIDELGYDRHRVLQAVRTLGIRLKRLPSYEPTELARLRAARTVGKRGRQGVHLGQATVVVPDEAFDALKAHFRNCPDDLRVGPRPWRREPGVWGRYGRPDRCGRCKRSDRPYHARDLCRSCFDRVKYWRKSAPRRDDRARARALALLLAPAAPSARVRFACPEALAAAATLGGALGAEPLAAALAFAGFVTPLDCLRGVLAGACWRPGRSSAGPSAPADDEANDAADAA